LVPFAQNGLRASGCTQHPGLGLGGAHLGEAALSELLCTEGIIRRLKKGAPIVLQKETIRLPRFTEIREIEPKEFGGKGKDLVVLARSRTATWALLPWPKKNGFALKDAQLFFDLVTSIQQQNPQKPVKGYVLVEGSVEDKGAALLEKAGHLASTIAE
jgi:hypothetical protein